MRSFYSNEYSSQDDFIYPCDKIWWHLFANLLIYHSDVEDFVLGRTKHHSKAILDQDRHLVARGSHCCLQNTFSLDSSSINSRINDGLERLSIIWLVKMPTQNSSMLLLMLMLVLSIEDGIGDSVKMADNSCLYNLETDRIFCSQLVYVYSLSQLLRELHLQKHLIFFFLHFW